MGLSIVIPCYNSGKKIGILLKSIFSQIVEDLEVVIINDGSRDNTLEVIEQVLEEFTHFRRQVRIISINNSGAGIARQVGLEKAKGDYVFFCDSDDKISSNFIKLILSAMNEGPDVIYYSSVVSDIHGNFIRDKIKITNDIVTTNRSDAFHWLFSRFGYTSAVWSFVFKRKVALDSGASFINRPVHEDHMFTLTLLGSSHRIMFIPDLMYYYVDEQGSLTRSSKDINYLIQRYDAYDETRSLVKTKFGIDNYKLYREWSIRSLLSLIINNRCLFSRFRNFSFLNKVICNDFFIILKVISKKVFSSK